MPEPEEETVVPRPEGIPASVEDAERELSQIDAWLRQLQQLQEQLPNNQQRAAFLNGYLAANGKVMQDDGIHALAAAPNRAARRSGAAKKKAPATKRTNARR